MLYCIKTTYNVLIKPNDVSALRSHTETDETMSAGDGTENKTRLQQTSAITPTVHIAWH